MNRKVIKLLKDWKNVQANMLAVTEVNATSRLSAKQELLLIEAQMMVDENPSLYQHLKVMGVREAQLRTVRNLMIRLRILLGYTLVSVASILLVNTLSKECAGGIAFATATGLILLTLYTFLELKLEGEE